MYSCVLVFKCLWVNICWVGVKLDWGGLTAEENVFKGNVSFACGLVCVCLHLRAGV